MNVLITGAAGYIGSHALKRLVADGHHVVAVDNLHRGHSRAVEAVQESSANGSMVFHQLDLHQTDALAQVMGEENVEAVMHFAALAYVGESVDKPLDYYQNNTAGSLSLLRAVDRVGVEKFVFSSTCATYGKPTPEHIPITENTPQQPINPYGWSKLMTERALIDYAAANERFAFAGLRYFNVAGSAHDGTIGEDHDPETHLIPVLLDVARGRRDHATVNGNDYDTPDGTPIRDYIHVEDLIDAHVTVMHWLGSATADQANFYNLGTGRGHSVLQIIDAVGEVTGAKIPVEVGPRRPGDPPTLYADPGKLQRQLNWSASQPDIRTAVADAWQWFKAHPDGYAT